MSFPFLELGQVAAELKMLLIRFYVALRRHLSMGSRDPRRDGQRHAGVPGRVERRRQRDVFYLHILDAASNRAFDEDGSTYSRLDLTLVRTYVLGDRWQGDVSISGNSVLVVTNSSLGGHGVASATIEARKP